MPTAARQQKWHLVLINSNCFYEFGAADTVPKIIRVCRIQWVRESRVRQYPGKAETIWRILKKWKDSTHNNTDCAAAKHPTATRVMNLSLVPILVFRVIVMNCTLVENIFRSSECPNHSELNNICIFNANWNVVDSACRPIESLLEHDVTWTGNWNRVYIKRRRWFCEWSCSVRRKMLCCLVSLESCLYLLGLYFKNENKNITVAFQF